MVSNISPPSMEAHQFLAEPECLTGSSDCSESSSGGDLEDVILAPPASGPDGYKQSIISLAEFSRVLRHPTTGELTSLGSVDHFRSGSCAPCEWLQRRRYCRYDWRCPYCHCLEGHQAYIRRRHRKSDWQPRGSQ